MERAMRELASSGWTTSTPTLRGNLAYGSQRLLRSRGAGLGAARFLILDEPAGVNDQETADLMLLIKAIQKRGITILLIEHDMNPVMRVCEKIVVLEKRALSPGPPPRSRGPRVIEAYLGAWKARGC